MQGIRDSIGSSPLVADVTNRSLGSSSPPSSPTPGLSARTHRKRPSEDMTQFSKTTGRVMKLRKTDQDILNTFSKFNENEQRIWLAASLLKVQEHQEKVTLPDTVFTIPKKLENQIEYLTFSVLLDPNIPAYLDNKKGPAQIIYDMLESNASWGLTTQLKEDKAKVNVIMTRIQNRLTHRRHAFKNQITKSFGKAVADTLNIVELCLSITQLCRRARIEPSVQLCARLAFLHGVAADPATNLKDYWKQVDQQLEKTRVELKTPDMQSKFFAKLLQVDRNTYGDTDINKLSSSLPQVIDNGAAFIDGDDAFEADGNDA